MRELEKAAADNHLDVATQLQVPYKWHTIRVDDIPVLDLRDERTQTDLGWSSTTSPAPGKPASPSDTPPGSSSSPESSPLRHRGRAHTRALPNTAPHASRSTSKHPNP